MSTRIFAERFVVVAGLYQPKRHRKGLIAPGESRFLGRVWKLRARSFDSFVGVYLQQQCAPQRLEGCFRDPGSESARVQTTATNTFSESVAKE